jgi:hypothetical protein
MIVVSGPEIRRVFVLATSGGGAIGEISGAGLARRDTVVADKGIEGVAAFHATMLGTCTSCLSFTLGGVMIV